VAPNFKTPYAHHASVGFLREWPRRMTMAADVIYARGQNQVGTLDYNPLVPELGPGRRPDDEIRGAVAVAGTSASLLQYTSFGQTWYRGLALSLASTPNARYNFRISYTLSKTEDNSTDYQNAFIPEDTGKGRDRSNPTGLPIGFDPLHDKGPSLQDQRHRLVVSGSYALPAEILVSPIVTVGSGRPYNILAGEDLNGDGDGGAFPADRARRNPLDAASSVTRNSGVLPMSATTDVRVSRRFRRNGYSVDGIIEVFNLFNRTNFTEINNIFGKGAYPAQPSATFGQFEKAGPPLQAQLAVRVNF
jgi:outer membrane receptor for Fe3+-dicitrate